MESKKCGKCGKCKPESEWSPSKWLRSGNWCRDCSYAYQKARYSPEYLNAYHRKRYTPKTGADDTPRNCKVCGVSYQPRQRKRSWYCSPKCKQDDRAARDKARRLAAKPADRFCLQCGVTMPQSMRKDAVFCSQQCNESAHRLQRTLRRRTGEGMTGWVRAEIFHRDGWKCGICRKKVNPDLRYPDPMAPSLDHVLPIADGGGNEPANLRLTHLTCNVSRKHLGGNEQLALV